MISGLRVLSFFIAVAYIATASAHGSPASSVVGKRPVTAIDLIELTDVNGLAISPDRSYAAFQLRTKAVKTNSYRLTWYVKDLSTDKPPLEIGDGGAPIVPPRDKGPLRGIPNGSPLTYNPSWSPDSRKLVYAANTNSSIQLWLASIEGASSQQITFGPYNVRAFYWSNDGQKIHYKTGPNISRLADARQAESDRGFLYDKRTRASHSRLPLWVDPPAGEPRFHIRTYDLATRDDRQATADEREAFTTLGPSRDSVGNDYWMSKLSRDNSLLAYVSINQSARKSGSDYEFFVTPVSGAEEPIVCSAAECSTGYLPSGLWWGVDNQTLYFAKSNMVGKSHVYVWDIVQNKVKTILETTDTLARGSVELSVSCELTDDQTLLCLYETPTRPRRLVTISLHDGGVATVFDPNPQFRQIDLPAIERLQWVSPSGVETYGYWIAPDDVPPGKPSPAVVVQYSCDGFLLGGTGDEFPIFLFAANGIGVFCHESFVDRAIRGQLDLNDVLDQAAYRLHQYALNFESIDAELDRLVDQGFIRPDEIGITGLSYGSELLFFGLVNSDRRFAASASSMGAWEPTYYYMAGPAYHGVMKSLGYGFPGSELDLNYDHVSVTRNVARINTPLLIQAAEHELLWALPGITVLQEYDKPAELIVFEDERHIKRHPVHLYHLYRRYLQWFKFWLQDEEVNDPVDPEQYIRWRKLRAQHETNLAKQGLSSRPER